MYRNKTFNRKKVMIVFVAVFFIMMFLIGRLVYLMIFCSEYYGNLQRTGSRMLHLLRREPEVILRRHGENFWMQTAQCLPQTNLCARSP